MAEESIQTPPLLCPLVSQLYKAVLRLLSAVYECKGGITHTRALTFLSGVLYCGLGRLFGFTLRQGPAISRGSGLSRSGIVIPVVNVKEKSFSLLGNKDRRSRSSSMSKGYTYDTWYNIGQNFPAAQI